MKFKNVLGCTLAILPMFCAVESQAGVSDEYDKAMYEKKHNSEGYKNTQKLNAKQKLFLREVMGNRSTLTQIELCHMSNDNLKQCKDGSQGMGWRLPANNNSKYISNVTVRVEGNDSIITITASPEFGENVTLIYDCSVVSGHVECPISSKSSCLEKGLCSAGVYDVEPDDSVTLRVVEYKIK